MAYSFFVSIIVPVHNGEHFIGRCIAALQDSSYDAYEILVVDDGSVDNSAQIARKAGATVLHMAECRGPSAARNYAAQQAQGNLLLFVDVDVLIRRDTITRVVADFTAQPGIAAVFGTYDTEPEAENFLSQYKNLVHHFVHQQSNSDAATFWAGCGAVRKDIFLAVGGFDQKKYTRPCIEDIELGHRLKINGHRILMDKQIQVKHLKEWRLTSLLRADILNRAVPWTRLILQRKAMIDDLNLKISQKFCAFLTGLFCLCVAASFKSVWMIFIALVSLTVIILINQKLIRFFLSHRSLSFTIGAFGMHLLYYLYSGVTFIMVYLLYKLQMCKALRRKRSASGSVF